MMLVFQPYFKWILLAGIISFSLCIYLEIRVRKQRKQQQQSRE